MPLLTRYVLIELLKVFSVVLTAMTIFMMLFGVVNEAISQGLGAAQVALMLPYFLPEALRFAVPGTILFAVSSVYGRMSSSNEIVAAKSLGISPISLLWPMFVLAFLLSLATVWLNDLAVSWGRNGIQRVIVESVEEIVYGMLRTHKSYSTKQFSINVKRVDERTLVQPILTFQPTDDTPLLTLTADSAQMRSDPAQNTLTIYFQNVTIDVGEEATMELPQFERVVPLTDATGKGDGSGSPSQVPLRAIPREIVQQKLRIRQSEQQLAANAGYQLMTGDFAALTSPQWRSQATAVESQRSRLCRLETEPYRRWANGFSCLCFVIIGAPVAIRFRNSDFLTSFFKCFGPILLLYYPLLAFAVGQAKSGSLPPYSVWLGNIILMCIGVWQLRKVVRY